MILNQLVGEFKDELSATKPGNTQQDSVHLTCCPKNLRLNTQLLVCLRSEELLAGKRLVLDHP